MNTQLRIVMAQLNFTVGAIEANTDKIINACINAKTQLKADMIVFPELVVSGYSPEDLLLRPEFIQRCDKAVTQIMEAIPAIHCVLGTPIITDQGLQNCALVLYEKKIVARYAKCYLPNRGIFDEKRYFTPGNTSCCFSIKERMVALLICEDIWHKGSLDKIKETKAELILALNASPFEIHKAVQREHVLANCAAECKLPIIYVNHCCGQDDIVYDGGSIAMNANAEICVQAPFFAEALTVVDFEAKQDRIEDDIFVSLARPSHLGFSSQALQLVKMPVPKPLDRIDRIYHAIILGIRDYVQKNAFKGVIIGNSGGIDSAVSLALAVAALGAHKVRSVMMPSRHTAQISIEDAAELAHNLKIAHDEISIEPIYEAFLKSLRPLFAGTATDITEENLQARCRGTLLMALSNKTHWLVLNTSNRSEMAVGYSTLYGDMCGGYGVLKDVLKTDVYHLAHFINQLSPTIPNRIITRPPSAELAPDQKDQDTLPDYNTLDQIIEFSVEKDCSIGEIIAKGFNDAEVKRSINMIYKNEYKRRQSTPGVRINHRAFGKDRRYPITNGFKE